MTHAHKNDGELAALVDDNRVADDVTSCPTCSARVLSLRAVVADLHTTPQHAPLAARVQERLRARSMSTSWLAVPAFALVACVALVVVVPRGAADAPMARGAGDAVPVVLHVSDALHDVALHAGDAVDAPVSLRVSLALLPSSSTVPRALAVVALDAHGRVTWLRPSYTDPSSPPSCLAVPAGAVALPAQQAVTLDDTPAGPLTVHAFLLDESACDVRALDDLLEHGQLPPAQADVTLSLRVR
jgi:hypothetical protein